MVDPIQVALDNAGNAVGTLKTTVDTVNTEEQTSTANLTDQVNHLITVLQSLLPS